MFVGGPPTAPHAFISPIHCISGQCLRDYDAAPSPRYEVGFRLFLATRGPSMYDVRSGRGGEGHPKQDEVREVA